MKRSLALLLSAIAVLAAAPPARAQTAPPYTVVRDSALTADGVTLALRHLVVPGGAPVLMIHGFGTNMNEWDLPSKSFADYLARQGFDVWLANTRRTGKAPDRSGGRPGFDFDDLMAYDMPALVDRVARATGQRPFLVGHSLGAMATYAYLEGAHYERQTIARVPHWSFRRGFTWVDVKAPRVAADPKLAQARNAAIRGAIAIAGPPRMKWSDPATFFDFWQHDYWDYNLILSELAWDPLALAAAYTLVEVPVGQLTDFLTRDIVTLPYVGPQLQPYLQAVATQVGTSFLASDVAYGPNMDGQAINEGLAIAVSDQSTGILRQFTDAIRYETFREAHVLDPARSPYVYADHYDRVTAPILVVAGIYDKLCDDEVLHDDGFLPMGSQDKTFFAVAAGHVDLVIGIAAPQDVWAPAASWLSAH